MPEKMTVPRIRAMRTRGERVVCLTAYDATLGALADAAGADLVLVGDSLGNVILGYSSTVPVSLDAMVHHTRATRVGVSRALLVADMPFGSYQSSVSQAVDTAVTLMKAGAEAVKLEGDYVEQVRAITRAGIPVVGHLGLTPQSVNAFGGFRVQGRGDTAPKLMKQARDLADAGAFAMVLELMSASLATEITRAVDAVTIGIGAGPGCNGEVQVIHDVLGLMPQTFKHARAFVQGRELLGDALTEYVAAVRAGTFPATENSFE